MNWFDAKPAPDTDYATEVAGHYYQFRHNRWICAQCGHKKVSATGSTLCPTNVCSQQTKETQPA